jgi:hypothetical protein
VERGSVSLELLSGSPERPDGAAGPEEFPFGGSPAPENVGAGVQDTVRVANTNSKAQTCRQVTVRFPMCNRRVRD